MFRFGGWERELMISDTQAGRVKDSLLTFNGENKEGSRRGNVEKGLVHRAVPWAEGKDGLVGVNSNRLETIFQRWEQDGQSGGEKTCIALVAVIEDLECSKA